MMAADYRHIGGRENRLGRHYSRFAAFLPAASLADQLLTTRKSRNGGSNRRSWARTSANIGASLMPAGGGCLIIHFAISRSPPAHAAAGSDCALPLGIAART